MKYRASPLLGQLSTFLHSVRFRMALWFALVLAVVLFVFSAFVYYRTAYDVHNQTAAQIVIRLRDLNAALVRNYREHRSRDWWRQPEGAASNSFALYDHEIMIFSDNEGQVARWWGSIDEQEAVRVAAQAAEATKGKKNSGFFSYTLAPVEGQQVDHSEYLFDPTPIYYEDQRLGWMILGRPADPEGQLPRLFWTLVLAGSFTLLLALAGGYWLASRALWPVQVITRAVQEISATDLNRRLNLHTRDELGELAGTFDRMLDRLQAAFDRQRQFTADASHELRTPLTIIELETSRALASKRPVESYQHALRLIQSENAFMTRLVEELLLLARMDAGQANLKREVLDLSDLALEAVERYAPLAVQKQIQLKTGNLPELPIQGDRQFLLQMIGNLIDNAIKYSPHGHGQWVCVETNQVSDGSQAAACLRVSDNGPGIAAEHLPHLFDRFYRADRARSHNPDEEISEDGGEITGSGLGLSIVQWIAEVHGGSARVISEAGQGAIFEVQLPLLVPGPLPRIGDA